jgi:hypothetical protein
MAFSVGELVGSISLNDQFSGGIDNIAKKLGLAGESFGAITGFATIAAGAIAATTGAIVALGTHGAQVADVQGAFENLTAAAGSSAGVMLGELQGATLGTISNFDLMREANALLSAGLLTGNGDMKTLAEGAKLLADQTGGETAAAFGTLSGAILSGRGTQLAQMGLFVDTKKAVEDYALAHGKLPGQLTAAEEKMAIAAATVAALKEKLEAGGPAVADFGDLIDIGKVAVQNFTDNLGVSIARSPVVVAGMDAMRDALQGAFGGSQQETIKTIMGFVNDFAIKLVDAALVGVTGAGIFVTAWSTIKTAVLGVITVVAACATALVGFVSGVAELAAKIPGASGVVDGFAAGAKALEGNMTAVTLSMADQTAEAAKGVLGNSELHHTLDTVAGTLLNMRDKMEAAKDQTAELTGAAATVKAKLDEATGAAGLTAAQMDAIALAAEQAGIASVLAADAVQARFMTLQDELTAANLTGLDARLFDINTKRQEELLGLETMTFSSVAEYEKMVALVTAKYAILAAAAAGYHANIVVQAGMAGLQTRASLEATAAKAIDTYDRMRESGLFTTETLREAWEKAEEAKRAATGATSDFTVASFGGMLTAIGSLMSAAGIRFKAVMLAGAVIAGWSAVQKALAAPPGWPFNATAVITVTALQLANVAKIASSPAGFAMGTGPGGRFVDFGRVSTVDLHGPEAIVTPKQGTSIADMVGVELAAREDRTVAQLQRMEEAQEARDRRLPLLLRDAALLAGA